MPMYQSRSSQLGTSGESSAELFFSDLGWGPLRTGNHDLGTDLFVQIRTKELRELGVMLGVQVKTGDSFFEEPAIVDGQSGWWFREGNDRHHYYWSEHHIPHILLMQNATRTTRVWAKLDSQTIESTGKGIRVFVPESQVLSADSADTWVEMATEARRLQSFEGSRWAFHISQVPESEWPRYALLASRIVAPHPNRGYSYDINWAEATALCLQSRSQDWIHFAAEHDSVPSPTEASASDDVGWRFAAAIHSWMEDSSESLETLESQRMGSPLRTAHAICLSSALSQQERREEAIEVLQAERDTELYSADQAWLLVHLGWQLYENRHIDKAESAFTSSLSMHAAFQSSLTNTAIRSAGILALFELTPVRERDVADAVQASDSTLSWWQTQQIESGLNNFALRSFRSWTRTHTIRYSHSDATHNNLLSAERSARLLGNRRSLRYAAYLRAITNLALPSGNHHTPESQLEILRSTGYAEPLRLALERYRRQGPLAPVHEFMRRVTISRASPTSIDADLEALKAAGSYVDATEARKWVQFLARSVNNPNPFMKEFGFQFDPRGMLMGALSGLRLHFSTEEKELFLSFLGDLPEEPPYSYKSPIQSILRHLREDLFTSADHMELAKLAASLPETSWLKTTLLDTTATFNSESRETVRQRMLTGSLSKIPDSFPVDELSEAEASQILLDCGAQLERYRGISPMIAVGGPDPYHITAVLALRGPDSLRSRAWSMLIDALLHKDALHDRKTNALEILIDQAEAIPAKHSVILLRSLLKLRELAKLQPDLTLGEFEASSPAFAGLYLMLSSDTDPAWRDLLSSLLTGSTEEKKIAVEVLSHRAGHELLLLTLSRDTHPELALAAMQGLARRAGNDPMVAGQVTNHLLSLVDSGGEQAALHIGGGLLSASRRAPETLPLVVALRSHSSLQIRTLAKQLND